MSSSGKSLFFFGVYVLVIGILFLTIPDTLVRIINLPALDSGWARVIGLLSLVIGTYDILMGKADNKEFIKLSVYIRLGFAAGTILLVIFGQMPASLILLGSVDALGSLWTTLALKSDVSKGN